MSDLAVKFNKPLKWVAREDTLIRAIRKAGITNPHVVSLCNLQETKKSSEIAQLVEHYGIDLTYTGIDRDKEIIRTNRAAWEGLLPLDIMWMHGNIKHVDFGKVRRHQDERLVVYLDLMGMADVFWTVGSAGLRCYNKVAARSRIALSPGVLPTMLDHLKVGDLVVVNVQTFGRPWANTDRPHDWLVRHYVPALLQSRKGWRTKPWMSGSQRNLDMDSWGPNATYYTYNSPSPHQGRPSEMTSFCLVR